MQNNKNDTESSSSLCVLSCMLNCELSYEKLNKNNQCKKQKSDDIKTRLRRNSQSNGIYIPVEILNEETTEQLSPDLKKKFVLTKRELSIDSIFNNSQILVSELHISEKIHANEISLNTDYFRNSGVKKFELGGIFI